MNKTTAITLNSLSRLQYGVCVVTAIENFPEIYKKNKNRKDEIFGSMNPLPLVKYMIRRRRVVRSPDVTLHSMRDAVDKYEVTEYRKFCGQFSFDKKNGGFVPVCIETNVSIWLKIALEGRKKEHINPAIK